MKPLILQLPDRFFLAENNVGTHGLLGMNGRQILPVTFGFALIATLIFRLTPSILENVHLLKN